MMYRIEPRFPFCLLILEKILLFAQIMNKQEAKREFENILNEKSLRNEWLQKLSYLNAVFRHYRILLNKNSKNKL